MEEKRSDAAGSPPPAASSGMGIVVSESPPSSKPPKSPATEPLAPRRRGQKRKSISSNSSLSSSSSAPPKRHAREKAAAAAAAAAAGMSPLLQPIHNGPLTRARQLSDTNAVLNAIREETARDSAVAVDGREEVDARKEEYEAFQAKIDAEFQGIRSRDKNCHVVPVAAGWFLWTDIHPLEKQALPSFFSGKSESRTPEIFMEIRNWIMKKFHANPCTNIELKDLSELSIGDLDARQEVMEFLDHWGLINYHPFPPNDPPNVNADPSTEDDKTDYTDSLIEKLYQFENEQSYPDLVPRVNISSQAMSSGLLRESAIAEEFIRQEGPAVEYHCNSCSADCSRKRYHCQKQADFDLCTECYNNGKFGSGMSSSDFILMEPGEASGASGGKWTDQETLLLLEALELFKENWNEIAEHVATKTKAQCILHFLQMPIEDRFLDDDDDTKAGVQAIAEPTTTSNDLSVSKDNTKPSDVKTCKDDADQAASESSTVNTEPESTKGANEELEPSEIKTDTNPTLPATTPMEISNSEEAQDGKMAQDKEDEVILRALTEAFNAVGCPVSPQDNLCFAEAGNSVMALAAFLTKLVDPSLATASACSSLMLMSKSSPGSLLATSHCFILEDPPDDKKDQPVTESTSTEKSDQNAQRHEGVENGKEIILNEENASNMGGDKPTMLVDVSNSTDELMKEKNGPNSEDDPKLIPRGEDVSAEEPQSANSVDEDKADVVGNLDKEKSEDAGKPDEKKSEDAGKPDEEKSEDAGKPDEEKSQIAGKPDEETSKMAGEPDEEKSNNSGEPNQEKSHATETPDKKTNTELGSKGVTEPTNHTVHTDQFHANSKDQDDSSSKVTPPSGSGDGPASIKSVAEVRDCTDASKDVDMESNLVPSDKMEQKETVLADSVAGVGSGTGDDKMEVDKSMDLNPSKTTKAVDHGNVSKLRRAAIATLSAAAVQAKLLANQEEDEIKQLATVLVEKQLRKLEIKLSFFTEMEGSIMRVREQLERSRQKLFAERAQIIASRLRLPASARGVPSSHPLNRMPAGLLNSVLRPPMNMRAPLSRPAITSAAPATNASASPDAAGDGPSRTTAAEKPPSAVSS